MKKAFWGPVKYQLPLLAVDLLGLQKRHLVFPNPLEDFGKRLWSWTCFLFALVPGVPSTVLCVSLLQFLPFVF